MDREKAFNLKRQLEQSPFQSIDFAENKGNQKYIRRNARTDIMRSKSNSKLDVKQFVRFEHGEDDIHELNKRSIEISLNEPELINYGTEPMHEKLDENEKIATLRKELSPAQSALDLDNL